MRLFVAPKVSYVKTKDNSEGWLSSPRNQYLVTPIFSRGSHLRSSTAPPETVFFLKEHVEALFNRMNKTHGLSQKLLRDGDTIVDSVVPLMQSLRDGGIQ